MTSYNCKNNCKNLQVDFHLHRNLHVLVMRLSMSSPRYPRWGKGWEDLTVSACPGGGGLNCACIPGKNKPVLSEKRGIKLGGGAFDSKKSFLSSMEGVTKNLVHCYSDMCFPSEHISLSVPQNKYVFRGTRSMGKYVPGSRFKSPLNHLIVPF